MGKRRTKKQKIKAGLRRSRAVVKTEPEKEVKGTTPEPEKETDNKKLIVKDLMKTVWVAVVLLVLLGVILWLERGSAGVF